MALTDKLSAIGVAIREKTGKTDLLTLDAMPAEILAITTGGGGGSGDCNGLHIPDEGLVITGDCTNRFADNAWNWYIETAGNKITTQDISKVQEMFYNCDLLTNIPFELNGTGDNCYFTSMFEGCNNLQSIPKMNTFSPTKLSSMFRNCWRLRNLPEDIEDWFDWSWVDGTTNATAGESTYVFSGCYSLRSIPLGFLKHQAKLARYNYSYYYYGFQDCYTLDELVGLPIPYTATWTSNAFKSTFNNCFRLKEITFATQEDGSPIVVNWSNQTIDLSSAVGYTLSDDYIIGYNSGITIDKKVSDDASYQALKDDPDWYGFGAGFSRYNHDSAVNTINSLPDASSGSGNTIKFRMVAGDGDTGSIGKAISNLTEEEIAVAAAKGWTVSLV